MSYSVLLIGATGSLGSSIAKKLAKYKSQLSRVAYLTAAGDSTPEKEARYKLIPLERVVGDFRDPETYCGFDILISAVNNKALLDQIDYFEAAFAGGVKHIYPSECKSCIHNSENRYKKLLINEAQSVQILEIRLLVKNLSSK